MLADILRDRRRERGLSLREAARCMGISAGYLSSLEHGRNPTTGRPPTPSPPVLSAIANVLGVDLDTLLELAGATPPASAHVLLVQLGAGRLPAREGARRAAPEDVDEWLELSEPFDTGRRRYDAPTVIRALPGRIVAAAREQAGASVGLIFGAAAHPLAHVVNPADLLAAEETWEDDVAHACRVALGRAPAANVCVYREADIRAVPGVDPLAVALALVQAHPHVAAQRDDGGVVTGVGAIEAVLAALRPDTVAPATWTLMAAAVARGLGRRAARG